MNKAIQFKWKAIRLDKTKLYQMIRAVYATNNNINKLKTILRSGFMFMTLV